MGLKLGRLVDISFICLTIIEFVQNYFRCGDLTFSATPILAKLVNFEGSSLTNAKCLRVGLPSYKRPVLVLLGVQRREVATGVVT